MDGFEILEGRPLKVVVSEPFCRLFLGNIPKLKTGDELHSFFSSTLDGVTDVITYSTPDHPTRNRGFCFLHFHSHTHAVVAKKNLSLGSLRVFGSKVLADWADPQQEPDSDTMSTVKVVYVRGLTKEVSEDDILTLFSPFGPIQRVKKLKDYAFVHFNEREDALRSIQELNGTVIPERKNPPRSIQELNGTVTRSAEIETNLIETNPIEANPIEANPIEVTLAKPPIDRHTREEMLKNRERRLSAQAKHINQLALDQRRRMRVLHGKAIVCGPKVTVMVRDQPDPVLSKDR